MGICSPLCSVHNVQNNEKQLSGPLLAYRAHGSKEEEQNEFSDPAKKHWEYPYNEKAWTSCCDHPPGQEQSPIDLTESLEKLPFSFTFEPQYTTIPIKFDVTGFPVNLVNNGNTIQMNAAKGQTLTILDTGDVYNLLQFHFHTTSEHTVNKCSFLLEMHLVHQHHKMGNLLVLGIFFDPCEEEKANDFLSSFWDYLPGSGCKTSDKDVQLHLSGLSDAIAGLSFYNYSGSLTTPPLSEGVTWIVAKEPLRCTKAQVRRFRERSGQDGNFRPPQPLNNRKIYQAKIAS